MAQAKGKWVWIGLAVALLATAGTYALKNFVVMKNSAADVCAGRLSNALGRTISSDEVHTTIPEVHFASQFDKRFRCTCTFEGVTLDLESTPIKPWRVVHEEGLDLAR